MDELRKVTTPEGFEGWQWEDGPVFIGVHGKMRACEWGTRKFIMADLEEWNRMEWERARKNWEATLRLRLGPPPKMIMDKYG